jgi:hypothetical protein
MKISVSILIAFISIIVISSCSKKSSGIKNSPTDSTNNNDTIVPIIGEWEADSSSIVATVGPFEIYHQDTVFTHGHSIIQIFNADSTGLLIDDTQSPPDTTAGNYYLANDTVYTLASGQSSYIATGKYTINANHLTLAESEDSLGAIITGTLYLTKQ